MLVALRDKNYLRILFFRDEYDFIVVGGGTAGSVLAHRLAEQGNVSILVVEAGRHDYDSSIRIPIASQSLLDSDKNLVWNYKTSPQKHSSKGFVNNQMSLPLGKVLGGSSSVGDMVYGRGNPNDYLTWGSTWSWDSLLPYFMKSEKNMDIDSSSYHSNEGELPVCIPAFCLSVCMPVCLLCYLYVHLSVCLFN